MKPYICFAQVTRYGIYYVVNQLTRPMSKPVKLTWGQPRICFPTWPDPQTSPSPTTRAASGLLPFSNANWGNNPDKGKSKSSYIVMLANAPISFKVGLQGLTAQSMVEAELVEL